MKKIILSVEGEEKAKKLIEIKEFNNIVWSSSYVRAKATAKYIAFKNNIDNRLNERKLGNLDDLKKLGKIKNHLFTIEQLLDSKLKSDELYSTEIPVDLKEYTQWYQNHYN